MNIQAVCTDIDGTLLNRQRQLSQRTIAAIARIRNMPVILASSRMPSAMRHLQQELDILHHPLICYNGGYVLRFANGTSVPEVMAASGIGCDTASSIVGLTKGTEIHTSIYREDEWHAPCLDQWTDREQSITKVSAIISDVTEVIGTWNRQNRTIHKIMCMGPETEIGHLEQQLISRFSTNIHIYRSRSTYLELAPRAISKATALQLVLEKYGIPLSAVMAFGDNYNDIDMIQSVGWGIAVGNARDEVKAVAREITFNSVDDGVAASVEKYFP
jgi:Cof subfamily protein (haloacid dehalogenase superfamily)